MAAQRREPPDLPALVTYLHRARRCHGTGRAAKCGLPLPACGFRRPAGLCDRSERSNDDEPAVTLFGLLAVSFMMVMYALEQRRPIFILAFALGCLLSSAYGFLSGAWPFGVVELIWSVVAVRRYLSGRGLSSAGAKSGA